MSSMSVSSGESVLSLASPDLRPEVISLAREIERLPPGNYNVIIEKPNLRGLPWRIEIARTETLRIVDLMR